MKVRLLAVAVVLTLLIGEIMCVVKAVRCDWKPIGKAEIIYTASAATGLGGIVGWMNIKDESITKVEE